jgi:membrane fusion protein, multidrug efflux system
MSTIDTPPMHLQATPRRRTRRLLMVALLVTVVGLLYSVYWWSYDRFYVRTDNAYVTGNLVPVAAQATGIITNFNAEETQFVNKGDLVMRLDEHQAYAALGRARGHLGETVRRITALFIRQRQVEEKLSARTARLDLVRHDIVRYQQASPRGAVSKQILQNAMDQLRAVEADVRETQAEYDALTAEVGGTTVMEHPAVELAKHEFIEAHLEYDRQQIRAPVSGYIAKRKGQVGDRVKPGAVLMTIVPLEHLWVEANLRETELRDVRPGQSAMVTVDLHGRKQTYHGTVEGLVPGTGSAFALLPPDNATGNFIHIVERVPVRIALPVEEIRKHPLRPGLSTVTQIDVSAVGQSVWSSLANVSTDEYQTDVYADELSTAGILAEDIIEANVVSKEHRLAAEQWRTNRAAALPQRDHRPQNRANTPALVPAADANMSLHARHAEGRQRIDMTVME